MTGRNNIQKLFWFLLPLFIITTLVIINIDAELRTPVSPLGILSFEFCAFSKTCISTLDAWGQNGQKYALLLLGIDYLYLFVYPALIVCALFLLEIKMSKFLKSVNKFAIWACPLITVADALENFGLIQVILSGDSFLFGTLGGVFAVTKFVFLASVLCWLLFVTIRHLVFKMPC